MPRSAGSCCRADWSTRAVLPLRSHAHPRPRGEDQHAAERAFMASARRRRNSRSRCTWIARRGARARSGPASAFNALFWVILTATGQRLGRDCSVEGARAPRSAPASNSVGRRCRQRPRIVFGCSSRLRFTGGGEIKLASKASLALTERGARILRRAPRSARTRTMHAQIVAEAPAAAETIEVTAADTGAVPDSGPTVASRTCMIVGRIPSALRRRGARAARDLTARILRRHPLVITREHERPREMSGRQQRPGRRVWQLCWGCDVVEVEVDPVTWNRPVASASFTRSAGDSSVPSAGQLKAAAQGSGYALLEEVAARRI